MRALLDASVLVAAFVGRHPNHAAAANCLREASGRERELSVAAHSLAEAYAVLTCFPLTPRISGGVARKLIRENLAPARVIAVTVRDYEAVLDRMADLGLAGGAVYDALIVQAAIRARADRLFTFNGAHFRRVWPEAGDRLAVLA